MINFFFENNLLISALFLLLSLSLIIIHFSLARRAQNAIKDDLKVQFETELKSELKTEFSNELRAEFEIDLKTEIQKIPEVDIIQIEQSEANDSSNQLPSLESEIGKLIEINFQMPEEASVLNLVNKADVVLNTENALDSESTEQISELSIELKRINAIELFFEKDAKPTEKDCDLDFFNKLTSYYKQSS